MFSLLKLARSIAYILSTECVNGVYHSGAINQMIIVINSRNMVLLL